MKRLFGVAIVAGVTLLGLSCGGDGPTQTGGPGVLKVRLTSPVANADSAILFTITGPATLTDVTPGAGLRVWWVIQFPPGTTTRFALIGSMTNGTTILTIGVPDVGALSQYSGAINGVALPSYQLRALPGGYALALTR